MRSASVQSTLQVKIRGVDWPALTSITKITVPESWRGTMALFGNSQQQGNSLSCFMPVDQGDFQSAPPSITVDSTHANVDITNVITMIDAPGIAKSWDEGLWSVVEHPWGYQVSFNPAGIPAASAHGRWTVMLDAPGLNIQGLSRAPSTDDGHGKLAWSFSPSRRQLTAMTVSLTSPWQVRTNLATHRWPIRWAADASASLRAAVIQLVALWLGFRFLRLLRRRGASPERRQLPKSLIFISLFSIVCHAGYAVDDYFWHNFRITRTVSFLENLAVLAIATAYFLKALGIRPRFIIPAASIFPLGLALVYAVLRENFFTYYVDEAPRATATIHLLVLMIPLLLSIALMWAGTVLWISRLWPFGPPWRQGYLRDWGDTPFRGLRVIPLFLGALLVGGLILGQSAGASYYYWQHADLWGQSYGGFRGVAADLLADTHWWIGGNLQWPMFFAACASVLAVLRAMNADARGVFFGPYTTYDRNQPNDRRDLILMAAIVSSFFIGTVGTYEGVAVPLAFIVGFVGLAGFGLTRGLSKLDWQLGAQDLDRVSNPVSDRSYLVAKRSEFLSGRRDRKLPKTADPGVIALALGPADTWWDNGVTALKTGGYLAVIPIAFDTYWDWATGNLSQLTYPFGLQEALCIIAAQTIAWLLGIFMFGALLPYLRGVRTPIKGLIFGLINLAAFAPDAAVRHALGIASNASFPVDGLLGIGLFLTVGILLDFSTLRNNHVDQGLAKNLYPFGSLRVAVTALTTLIVVGVTVWQTIYLTHQTAEQRAQNIANTAQYVNSVGGITPPASGGAGG